MYPSIAIYGLYLHLEKNKVEINRGHLELIVFSCDNFLKSLCFKDVYGNVKYKIFYMGIASKKFGGEGLVEI